MTSNYFNLSNQDRRAKMKIYIHGSLKKRNFGDELLVIILAKKIKEKFPNVLIYISANEDSFNEINSNVDVNKLSNFAFFRNINIIIFGGGGYFGSPSAKRSKWDIGFFIRFIPIAIARKIFSIKVCIYGVGAGPMPSLVNRTIMKSLLKMPISSYVRDRASSDFFNSIGIPSEVVSDLVANKVLFDVKGRRQLSLEKYVIFHNVQDEEYIKAILSLMPSNFKVVILVDSEKKTDSTLITEYLDLYKMSYKIEFFTKVNTLINIINESELVITNKLHVGILATTCNIPTVAVPHHLKTHRYYKMFNLSSLVYRSWADAGFYISNHSSFESYVDSLRATLSNRTSDYDELESFDELSKAITNSWSN